MRRAHAVALVELRLEAHGVPEWPKGERASKARVTIAERPTPGCVVHVAHLRLPPAARPVVEKLWRNDILGRIAAAEPQLRAHFKRSLLVEIADATN